MSISSLMTEIAAHDIALELNNGRLKITGTGLRPPQEFINRLRFHREEIITTLEGRYSRKNADFEERVAILVESGGHTPDDAHLLAMAEMGGVNLDLWNYHIERLKTSTSFKGHQLIKTAVSFLEGPFAAMAAHYGWDDLEIFGVFNGSPRAIARRHDAMGLIPSISWSQIGARLVDLDESQATIETRGKNLLTHSRRLTGKRYSVPVWWSEIALSGQI